LNSGKNKVKKLKTQVKKHPKMETYDNYKNSTPKEKIMKSKNLEK